MSKCFCKKTFAHNNIPVDIHNLNLSGVGIYSKHYNKTLLRELGQKLHCPFVITDDVLVFDKVDSFPHMSAEDEYLEEQKMLIFQIIAHFLHNEVKTAFKDYKVGSGLYEFVLNAMRSPLSASYINEIVDKNIFGVSPKEYAEREVFNRKTKIFVRKINLAEQNKIKIIFGNYAEYSPTVEAFINKRINSTRKLTCEEIEDDSRKLPSISGLGRMGVTTACKCIERVGDIKFDCIKDPSGKAWYNYHIVVARDIPWTITGINEYSKYNIFARKSADDLEPVVSL